MAHAEEAFPRQSRERATCNSGKFPYTAEKVFTLIWIQIFGELSEIVRT